MKTPAIAKLDTIAKAVVGACGLAITALQPVYGGEKWFVAVDAVYGALAIYFTKNLSSPVTVQEPQETK